jgi:hypothetical protein
MNGCQYAQKRFSAPASWHTSQVTWDYAFLTKQEFITKWGEKLYAYTKDSSRSTRSHPASVD